MPISTSYHTNKQETQNGKIKLTKQTKIKKRILNDKIQKEVGYGFFFLLELFNIINK